MAVLLPFVRNLGVLGTKGLARGASDDSMSYCRLNFEGQWG